LRRKVPSMFSWAPSPSPQPQHHLFCSAAVFAPIPIPILHHSILSSPHSPQTRLWVMIFHPHKSDLLEQIKSPKEEI
jgi:hypothetical protein